MSLSISLKLVVGSKFPKASVKFSLERGKTSISLAEFGLAGLQQLASGCPIIYLLLEENIYSC